MTAKYRSAVQARFVPITRTTERPEVRRTVLPEVPLVGRWRDLVPGKVDWVQSSSAIIAGELGIPADVPQHASYNGWLGPLKKDKREIFRSAADAQKIVDIVLGFHPGFEAQPVRIDRVRPQHQ
jgi:hypothetical protein